MKRILESLHTLEGVQGTLVVDGAGQILACQAHALYDISLLEQVSKTIAGTVDAVRLLHEDWDALSANFSEGNLVLRNLKPGGAAEGNSVVLALIADSRLNTAFAGVALRVATAKLKSHLESPSGSASAGSLQKLPMPATPGGLTGTMPAGSARANMSSVGAAAPNLGSSGLSWSGLGSSMGTSSEVFVADPKSSAFLTACAKALTSIVGPMAKIFVKEAVRQICPDRPFSRAQAEALLAVLATHIEDRAASAEFHRKVRALA
jgi:hypothetical protein